MAKNQKFLMAKKIGQNGDCEAMLKFWPKIECTRPVWYVEANMARSCRLACLKIEGNNLLK